MLDADPKSQPERDTTSTAGPEGIPIWFTGTAAPVYAVVHEPKALGSRDTAVLLMPTYGWDESCSYRARREWAVTLANAGYTAVRFDLPGAEESVGAPLAPGREESWLAAISELCTWLREAGGARRVATIGLSLGGLLSLQSLQAGASIDDLLLWATPSKGRAYLRELRMYADAMNRDGAEPERDDGALVTGGYLMSAETAGVIGKLDFGKALPEAAGRNVLMVDRDEHGVDERLRAQLIEAAADVTVIPSDEYSAMITFPDESRLPLQTIARSVEWLGARSQPNEQARSLLESPLATPEIVFDYKGTEIRERQVEFETVAGRLVGILAEPISSERSPFCIVTANAGALRRTSPARMWTDLGRRSAGRGIPALRVDIEGLGDSESRFIRSEDRTPADEKRIITSRTEVHDALADRGVADRFLTVGHCLGAYWELKVAPVDKRVRMAMLFNLPAFDWTPEQVAERLRRVALGPVRHLFRSRPDSGRIPSAKSIKGMAQGVMMTFRGVLGDADQSQLRPATQAFDKLAVNRTPIVIVFAQAEALHSQMRRVGLLKMLSRWPLVTLEQMPTKDHELRPLHIQQMVQDRIDAAADQLMGELKAPRQAADTRGEGESVGVERASMDRADARVSS